MEKLLKRSEQTTEQFRACLQQLHEEVCLAARAGGRDPACDKIRIMAVTKYVDDQTVCRLLDAGATLIGENREQSLSQKFPLIVRPGVDIHFIGHLQRNKAARVARMVSTVQSLDSLPLAQQLDMCARELEKQLHVYVEVNIGQDPNKTGVDPAAAAEFVDALREYPALRVKGLMTLLPLGLTPLESEKYFSRMNTLYVDIRAKNRDNVEVDTLSMGMSGDFRLAVKHGANLVRLGTVLFV